jgi:hypothetical protein
MSSDKSSAKDLLIRAIESSFASKINSDSIPSKMLEIDFDELSESLFLIQNEDLPHCCGLLMADFLLREINQDSANRLERFLEFLHPEFDASELDKEYSDVALEGRNAAIKKQSYFSYLGGFSMDHALVFVLFSRWILQNPLILEFNSLFEELAQAVQDYWIGYMAELAFGFAP